MVHSISREEADPDLDLLSEDMRVKSSMLLAENLEQTKAKKAYIFTNSCSRWPYIHTKSYKKKFLAFIHYSEQFWKGLIKIFLRDN